MFLYLIAIKNLCPNCSVLSDFSGGSMIELETERLIIRSFEENDYLDMYNNWASDTDVARWLSWKPHKNVTETKKLIKRWIGLQNKNSENKNFAIVLKETNEVIGNLSTARFSEKFGFKKIELGYLIARKYWNRGLATESVKAFVNYLFMVKNYNRITITYDISNIASGRVASKCGFQKEGVLREFDGNNTNYLCDVVICAILKREWDKQKNSKL